jgi:nuclear GTP-binding protein
MYRRGKPVRSKDGKIIGGTLVMSNKAGGKDLPNVARIAPDRRWFGNTRTISQNELDKFRDEVKTKEADPYSVILRRKKIPMALLQDSQKVASINILETEKFETTFGKKQLRKRPKIDSEVASSGDYAALLKHAAERNEKYESDPSKDRDLHTEMAGTVMRGGELKKDDLFAKGQSKRIWGELYKVLDCSDVVLEVINTLIQRLRMNYFIDSFLPINQWYRYLVCFPSSTFTTSGSVSLLRSLMILTCPTTLHRLLTHATYQARASSMLSVTSRRTHRTSISLLLSTSATSYLDGLPENG